MKRITVSEIEFKETFNEVLEDNPTITRILAKETNLGFTSQLIIDQLRADLVDKLFSNAEETASDVEREPVKVSDDKETVSEIKSENEASSESEDEDQIEDDDLDELD